MAVSTCCRRRTAAASAARLDAHARTSESCSSTPPSPASTARGGGGSARIARSTSPSSASMGSQRGGATRGSGSASEPAERTTRRASSSGGSRYATSPRNSASCAASSRARFCSGVADSITIGACVVSAASAAWRRDVGRKRCDSSTTTPSNDRSTRPPRLNASWLVKPQRTPARRAACSHVAGVTRDARRAVGSTLAPRPVRRTSFPCRRRRRAGSHPRFEGARARDALSRSDRGGGRSSPT